LPGMRVGLGGFIQSGVLLRKYILTQTQKSDMHKHTQRCIRLHIAWTNRQTNRRTINKQTDRQTTRQTDIRQANDGMEYSTKADEGENQEKEGGATCDDRWATTILEAIGCHFKSSLFQWLP